jgi:glyoxylase-like metal-dependent hydrolase (beta-lactamase superfamily II)
MVNYLHTITVPTPFPVGPINCYLAEGDELTLVDTGPKHPATLTALRQGLDSHGLALRDIRRVIITHAHVDHFGLLAQIVAESGAKILSHSRNRWWITDTENEWERRDVYYRQIFERSGMSLEYADNITRGMHRMRPYADAIPSEHFVSQEDDDVLELGGDSWRVVYAPGHASGLICLYEPSSGKLISSDHLLRDITSNPILEPPGRDETERPCALVDYIASMERTAQLPIRIALPAHGEPVYDVRALVDARVAFHRSRLNHIEQQLGCCTTTAFGLCNILFPDLQSFDIFLGLSEVIGHLDVLEAEGRVRREESGGVTRYLPTNVPV